MHPVQNRAPLPSLPSHTSDKAKSLSSVLVCSRHPHIPLASVAKGLMTSHLCDPLLLSDLVTPAPSDTAPQPTYCCSGSGSDTFPHQFKPLAEANLRQVWSRSISPQFQGSGAHCCRVLDCSHVTKFNQAAQMPGTMCEPASASPYHTEVYNLSRHYRAFLRRRATDWPTRHCAGQYHQLDRIWHHLGDKTLGMFVCVGVLTGLSVAGRAALSVASTSQELE